MHPSILVLAASVALLLPAPATADSGDLDGSFGAGGITVLDLGGEESARAMTADASGRIVVAGEGSFADPARPGATLPTVVRFLADGSLDPSFGGGDGVVQSDTGRYTGRFEAIMVDGSRRIVAVGTTVGFDGAGAGVVVTRFLDDGTPDPSFGNSGVVEFGTSGIWFARDGLIDNFGRIAIAAMSDGAGGLSPTAIRLLDDGSPDTTFGTNGVVREQSTRLESVSALLEPGTGGLLLAGATDREHAAALRLDDGGSPDPEFGRGGFATVRFRGASEATAATLGSQGRFVLAGSCECGRAERVAIASLRPSGGPDRTFSDDGRTTIRLGGPAAISSASAAIAGPPGALNVGANVDVSGPGTRAALLRLTKRGRLDTGFSEDGISSPSFRFNGSIYASNSVEAAAIDGPPNLRTSKIFLAGSVFGATTDLAVARLLP